MFESLLCLTLTWPQQVSLIVFAWNIFILMSIYLKRASSRAFGWLLSCILCPFLLEYSGHWHLLQFICIVRVTLIILHLIYHCLMCSLSLLCHHSHAFNSYIFAFMFQTFHSLSRIYNMHLYIITFYLQIISYHFTHSVKTLKQYISTSSLFFVLLCFWFSAYSINSTIHFTVYALNNYLHIDEKI